METVQAVVDEDLREEGVVAAPVDVGAVMGRHGGDGGHPTERDHHHDQSAEGDVPDAPDKGGRGRCHQVGREEGGQDEPRLEHLGLERQAHPHPGQQQRPEAPGRQRQGGGVGRQHQQEDEERVRDVAPIQQDGDGTDGQHQRGHQAGPRTADATDGAVEDEHRERTFDHLRQHDGPRVEAEDAQREGLDPQGPRQLVH